MDLDIIFTFAFIWMRNIYELLFILNAVFFQHINPLSISINVYIECFFLSSAVLNLFALLYLLS